MLGAALQFIISVKGQVLLLLSTITNGKFIGKTKTTFSLANCKTSQPTNTLSCYSLCVPQLRLTSS